MKLYEVRYTQCSQLLLRTKDLEFGAGVVMIFSLIVLVGQAAAAEEVKPSCLGKRQRKK